MSILRSVAVSALLLAGGLTASVAQQPAPAPSGGHAMHAAPAPAQGPWTKLAPFPEPAEEVLGAVAGGKLYVFAGLAPGWKPKALVFEYDPAANKWAQKKPMPVASHHVAFAALNDKIYAFGGFSLPAGGPPQWVPVDQAWEYDPAADSWKALAPMPHKRGAAGAAVANGKIYVVGGVGIPAGSSQTGLTQPGPQDVTGRVDEYDPATNSWTQKASMPTARNHHVVAAVNDKIYAIGGRIGTAFITVGSSNIGSVEEYDPATDRWSGAKARMPTPRSAVGFGVHNGRIYVAGGEYQDDKMLAAYKVVEAYEPATNRWHAVPAMQFPRHGLASGVIGNRLHLVSGDVQSAGNGGEVHVDHHDALALDVVSR
jgi:N-acetylneuraminic acid mutarotase